MLDRIGSRWMLTVGAAVMAVGQLTLGLTHSLPTAISGYGLVGFGDACVFISAIRLLPNWFAPRQVPLLTQLTGMFGQIGQVLSAVPFLAILLHHGWTTAYLSAAAMCLLSIVVTLAACRDTPEGPGLIPDRRAFRDVLGDVKAVWSRPGTRLGFFAHMGTPFPATVFALIWGVPYLTTAQGLSRSLAGGLLTLSVAGYAVSAVLIGIFSGRYPQHRTALVLTVIGLDAAIWTVVLLLPHPAPVWLLALLIVVIAIGLPTSVVAFDYARAYNPRASLGTAQGMVNTGGFIAALVLMQAVGVVVGAAGGYSFEAFRLAWTVQYALWAFATVGVLVSARQARSSERLGEPGPRVLDPERDAHNRP